MREIHISLNSSGISDGNRNTVTLIRMLQRAEGDPECFRTTDEYCGQKMCFFRGLCLPLGRG